MKLGKFPPELLERLRGKVEIKDDRVILGPKLREDAALLDYGDRVLVAKADPVTFANNQIGRYAVHVNANDMACCGATPRWYLATVLLPETCDEKDAEAIFDQILEACASLGVSLVGGHSEVTRGLSHPIIAGCMLGEAEKGKIVMPGGAKDGDSIVLTKGIALEGTALLAYDASDSLQKAGVGPEVISAAKQLLFYPGISVIKDALMGLLRGNRELHARSHRGRAGHRPVGGVGSGRSGTGRGGWQHTHSARVCRALPGPGVGPPGADGLGGAADHPSARECAQAAIRPGEGGRPMPTRSAASQAPRRGSTS